MSNKKVSFLNGIKKTSFVKKENVKNEAEPAKIQKDWKNSIYGFECANWANKC